MACRALTPCYLPLKSDHPRARTLNARRVFGRCSCSSSSNSSKEEADRVPLEKDTVSSTAGTSSSAGSGRVSDRNPRNSGTSRQFPAATNTRASGGPVRKPRGRGIQHYLDTAIEYLSPRQKGDTRDVLLICLSFSVLVYISQRLVCAYVALVAMPAFG
eukprot:TRINITY_DN1090_c0_g1_i4.p1 TRINITY_DN1090_c0_g1~~TRINITY_DN1090_c0_g1_i4.p1  ORF type:complete len:179 (+),score=3.51 TRINITY_DN1090_c0_g1_i4:62-538(+)